MARTANGLYVYHMLGDKSSDWFLESTVNRIINIKIMHDAA